MSQERSFYDSIEYSIDPDIGLCIQSVVDQSRSLSTFSDRKIERILKAFPKESVVLLYLLCSWGRKIRSEWIETQPYLADYKETDRDEETVEVDTGRKPDFSALAYTGNSCYMDSTLLALLTVPNKYVTERVLESEQTDRKRAKLQKEIGNITQKIRTNERDRFTVTPLRFLLKFFDTTQPFYKTTEQDAGEFLMFLLEELNMHIATSYTYTYGVTDRSNREVLTSMIVDTKASPIVTIRTDGLDTDKVYHVSHFVKQKDTADLDWKTTVEGIPYEFARRIQVTKVSSPYFIFYVQRLDTKTEKFIYTSFMPDEVMFSRTEEKRFTCLHLSAIVVHTGKAHYTAVIKKEGVWYWYNDNPGGDTFVLKRIGSYEEMLHTKPSPVKQGTMYFYS